MTTRPLGEKLRRSCPACGFVHFPDPKVGVGVVVVHAGELLLVRRAMAPERGKWSIPGGFLDHGEDPQVAAVREVQEETALDVVIDRLVDVFFNAPAAGEGGASLFVLYAGTYRTGTPTAGDDADAVGFFRPDELPELAFASTAHAVRRWLDEQAAGPPV
ncbi:MAG: NUDIX hydrolase [Actinomycetota bacterium]|nr:NUDIX hydrolase [Actinomycetota bacterium]